MRWRVEYLYTDALCPVRGPVSCPGLKLDSTFIMKCPAYTVTLDQWESRIHITDQLKNEDFFIQKRSSGNKIWQICPFSALWNNAGAACFCDSLNRECLVIRGAQCGGFHHFWPELLSYLSSSSLLIPRVTAISLLLGSDSVFIGGSGRCVGNDG